MPFRIHTVGASGSGTTTLANAIAQRLGFAHFDSDHYYWEKTDPPFTTKRPVEKRLRLLQGDLLAQESWVLSGSIVNWGEPIVSSFTHVVFIYIPPAARLARLRQRERERFGSRIDPGGDMHQIHVDLITWATKYDDGGLEVRSKQMHEQWLRELRCPVIRLEGELSTEAQLELVLPQL